MSVQVLALRTPTLLPATHTNCYRIGDVVIDPASPYEEEQERLWSWLEKEPPRRILLTHHHGDHIGGVEDLRRRSGARVAAHPDARLPFEVDDLLGDGDRIDTGAGVLICHHTPGHADGHLVFEEESSGDLVVGDLVASVGTIVLVPPEGKLGLYLDSLERMAKRGASRSGRFFPAHGDPIADGPGLARMYIQHRHMRTGQVRAALADGVSDAWSIAERIYAGIPGVNLHYASAQVETHLSWLREQER
ncbi:MAG TPA: MBL fold metallo-hydrolase [Myxococcota bacterium]|nr:MBL fold metallo-hydrolase [Myxococcota bacterium]HNH47870.1 MBL fold metallo-hydrolase [Myxococcota bacterium]